MSSDFGAMQNRLDHTINNLSVQEENITAAESLIRDVDMVKEMMAYTRITFLYSPLRLCLLRLIRYRREFFSYFSNSLNFHMGKGFFFGRSLFWYFQ